MTVARHGCWVACREESSGCILESELMLQSSCNSGLRYKSISKPRGYLYTKHGSKGPPVQIPAFWCHGAVLPPTSQSLTTGRPPMRASTNGHKDDCGRTSCWQTRTRCIHEHNCRVEKPRSRYSRHDTTSTRKLANSTTDNCLFGRRRIFLNAHHPSSSTPSIEKTYMGIFLLVPFECAGDPFPGPTDFNSAQEMAIVAQSDHLSWWKELRPCFVLVVGNLCQSTL